MLNKSNGYPSGCNKLALALAATSVALVGCGGAVDDIDGPWRVNASGKITQNGSEFDVRCASWFGLDGQHESSDIDGNPSGAPMELYTGYMWWQESGRTAQTTMDELKDLGLNMIRLPISPQTLDPNDPQGIGDRRDGGALKNHESIRQDNARQAMEDFIKLADKNNIAVLIDVHSCSNYVSWRAGRLDAAPPWIDANKPAYDYTREDYTCASGEDAYGEAQWLEDLKEIAGLSASLGVGNIVGIDIFNEPWDYTWAEWKDLAEKAYDVISAENDDLLIWVEGVGAETADGISIPHGNEAISPSWGENFYEFDNAPLDIPKEKLVLSPHTYGPSTFVHKQFLDNCSGLEGNAAGEAGCAVIIDPLILREGWDEHFGYLKDQGYAVIIGAFGGNMTWPENLSDWDNEKESWAHVSVNTDEEWQNALVDYMTDKNIEGCYWSVNPEPHTLDGSRDAIYYSPYSPDGNVEAFGSWNGFNSAVTTLLKRLWD